MTDDGLLDEAYERLSDTGPEYDGFLSNHGPMAADALLRLGYGDRLSGWLDGYARRLQEPPSARWRLDPDDWREVLGDPSRLGDWRVLLSGQVSEEPWEHVLWRWWPRLIPGAAASAAHGLIRTGHVVRALRERDTVPRRRELAEALAYWAARWQPAPVPTGTPTGTQGRLSVDEAIDGLPAVPNRGGFRTRLALVSQSPDWPAAVGAVAAATHADAVPAALDDLVDTTVDRYLRWGHANPVMLVHAVTAPRAVSLVLPSLPRELWLETYRAAWAVTAVIASAYRPESALPATGPDTGDMHEAIAGAVELGDEHAIKFAEAALDAHGRGSQTAAAASARAVALIGQER